MLLKPLFVLYLVIQAGVCLYNLNTSIPSRWRQHILPEPPYCADSLKQHVH